MSGKFWSLEKSWRKYINYSIHLHFCSFFCHKRQSGNRKYCRNISTGFTNWNTSDKEEVAIWKLYKSTCLDMARTKAWAKKGTFSPLEHLDRSGGYTLRSWEWLWRIHLLGIGLVCNQERSVLNLHWICFCDFNCFCPRNSHLGRPESQIDMTFLFVDMTWDIPFRTTHEMTIRKCN